MYKTCNEFEPECDDQEMKGPIYELKEQDIKDIRYVLLKPENRLLYDKTETFCRKGKEHLYLHSTGQQYFTAFGEISSFAMFVFIMFIFVEKHQHFAKQMVTSSLLIFASVCITLKMPREGKEDNQTIQMINKVPYLNRFCYFELGFLLKSLIYPNLFHCFLHISRLIDKPIEESLTNCYNAGSRHLTKAITALELVTKCRETDEAWKLKLKNDGKDPEDMLEEEKPDLCCKPKKVDEKEKEDKDETPVDNQLLESNDQNEEDKKSEEDS